MNARTLPRSRPTPPRSTSVPKKPAALPPPRTPTPVVVVAPHAKSYTPAERAAEFDGSFDTELFHNLDALDAVTAEHRNLALPSLAEARGYDAAMLYGLAEIAHHYLASGGVRIGLVLFEGLAAIAPEVAYFRLGLGFALDRSGRTDEAMRAYELAIALDPADGRAELNLAELLLEKGDRAAARARLILARDKARRAQEAELTAKAVAILSRVH